MINITKFTVHTMSSTYAFSVCNCIIPDILRFVNQTVLWRELIADISPPLFEIILMYMKKTEASLTENDTFAYPVLSLLRNFSKQFPRFHVDHGHALIWLWPTTSSDTSTDEKDTGILLK